MNRTMNRKNRISDHYKKFFDLRAKGIYLDEDDHLNLDWAEKLLEEETSQLRAEKECLYNSAVKLKNPYSQEKQYQQWAAAENILDTIIRSKPFQEMKQLLEGAGGGKPHSFCETPQEKCTMNYCDDNGCQNRTRNYVEGKEPNPDCVDKNL